jgi:hypothetical protein
MSPHHSEKDSGRSGSRTWLTLSGWLAGFRNWISLAGIVLVLASLFAFVLLFVGNLITPDSNPYVGILTFLITPAFTSLGVGIMLVGFWLRRRQLRRGHSPLPLVIDLSRPRDRRILVYFIGGSVGFLLVTAVGSYHSFHFTESTTFCGEVCHTIMEPERVTYEHSPHARVACVECHIGPGAEWYVRSKLSGLYQVYATVAEKYPTPVPTPIKNLRPAQDTCEQCHWPQKFSGNLVRTHTHYLSDATNTAYFVRLMLKVGGAEGRQGPASGIHWHVANQVDYLATDEQRLTIPWVRWTDANGVVTEYRAEDFTNAVDIAQVRRMDCMDCHNRPAHIYQKPNEAVDLAISLGQLPAAMLSVRSNATVLLTHPYDTVDQAMASIAGGMADAYPGDPGLTNAVAALQRIYRENFFPLMKANWRAYPEHIGHKDWPGCVRCHDDNHKSDDGQRVISFQNCNACHLILAQGSAADLEEPSLSGQEFRHPGEEYDPAFKCHDCHTGGPE